MRIEKWGFLLSYAIYLGFCIIFSIISKDTSAINTMIFAITIASTAFSISDLMFTKLDIDKKERESLYSLYHLTKYAKNFYINKIMEKYKDEADKMVSVLMELFDEAEIDKIISGSLTAEEKENYLDKIKEYSNDGVKDCLKKLLESDDEMSIEDDENDEKMIPEVLIFSKRNEKIKYILASSIAVMGLIALLVILTVRIEAIPYIINALTGLAFLAVILNLLLKEYYKANSLKKLTEEKNKLIRDISSRRS
ncbi:hypothetical protein Cpap_0468 [Ruminiclostridium papyrosolvens DSM 2782]|uniref:Uncharacterized protein n=1 Tax=Ruminiclostridium papyrosolvens DSM 2782 TaxID=588581 RepID=F1THH1_9FIRM|nr:hypothetical protein [Ruminiclostridium papyrosolvens]EGD46174.1 hypothetical protein Cpap_0468 [Ruminiclostridium papyrosolvens DSM 2782]WES35954.1 hypothetical protein P0092_08320 [Ruminiclostridium papyrosolvens DSM 2782]